MPLRLVAVVVGVLVTAWAMTVEAQAPCHDVMVDGVSYSCGAPSGFVTRTGSDLMLDGEVFRFSGPNIPWLALTKQGTYYPTHYEIDDAFATAQAMGATVVRSHTLGISIGCPKCIKPTRDTYNDAAFEPIDYAFRSAAEHGIKLVIPLVDNWDYYYGGRVDFATWYGVPPDAFFTDPMVITAYADYIGHILNHQNQYTGVRLGADPTVMAWETGNELNPADYKWTQAHINWTATVATHIKTLAPRHLVIDGHHASARTTHLSAAALALPMVDIYKGHFYPLNNAFMQVDATAAKNAWKVYIVGEYEWNGFSGGDSLASFTAIAENPANNVDGDLFWALYSHAEGGGWILGGGNYTFHWPGTTPDMQARGEQLRAHAEAMGQ